MRHYICLCQHRRAALDEDIESGHARGFLSHVGIEYEGGKISEEAGIIATKKLLLKVRGQLSGQYK